MLIKLRDQHEKFETMYQNWVGQFETWKQNNAAHPQSAEITQEWVQWQQKLLKRRSEIQNLIMQCVSKIERMNPHAVQGMQPQPEVTGVQQLLTQPSIAHLIRKDEKNGNDKQKEDDKDEDDCQVIENVEKMKPDPPVVITIPGEEPAADKSGKADAQTPGHRLTTIEVVPDPSDASSSQSAAVAQPQPQPQAALIPSSNPVPVSKIPPKYDLSDDEYGDEDPQIVKDCHVPEATASQQQAKEDEEEAQLQKAKAAAKEKQESFFHQFIGKMNDIIARNASKQDIISASPFYHNKLQQITPSKRLPVPQIGGSPAYQIRLGKKTNNRLNDDAGISSRLRNKSPPPDYVPPPSTLLGPSMRRPAKICFNCKMDGHVAMDCPNEKAARAKMNLSKVLDKDMDSSQEENAAAAAAAAKSCATATASTSASTTASSSTTSTSASGSIPMAQRRRKVYSESQQDLFPEAPKKITPAAGEAAAPLPAFAQKLLNPKSHYLMRNFEEDFYKLPEEPNFRIVSDDEAIREKQAEAEKRQQQQQDEERRYEEELRQRQQEYEKEYEQQYMEEYQRRKAQMDEIERLRRQELDPDRIGDQFLEKLKARNRIIDADEQQRMNEETEYIKMMQHPNRYSISRMIRELDQPIVIVIRGLIGSGKSKAAKCIKEEIMETDERINVRVISIDDYFMDPVETTVMEDGKRVTRKTIKYMYDPDKEEEYKDMMFSKLEKTLSNGQHAVVIIDACNNKKSDLDTVMRIVEQRSGSDQDDEYHRNGNNSSNQASLIVCEMEEWNEANCFKHGTHKRAIQDIHRMKRDWFDTPSDMNALDWSFKTSKAQQLKITSKDLESKPMHPELKRVLDHVDNNQKRMRGETNFGPGPGYHQQQDRRF